MSSRRRTVLIILIAVTLLFIWGNSLLNRELSTDESGFIVRIFDFVFGTGTISEHFIRKLAHFSEFALLGAELYCWFGRFLMGITHGLFAALADESLQMLSDRSAEVKDVLLDFSGVIFGAALCMLVIYLMHKKKSTA